MEYIIILLLGFFISWTIGFLGCVVGVIYNILEWITNKEFKWMYPVAGILWIIGFIPGIIFFILIMIWQIFN